MRIAEGFSVERKRARLRLATIPASQPRGGKGGGREALAATKVYSWLQGLASCGERHKGNNEKNIRM